MTDCETLHVSVDVENISDRTGKALVQIYVEPLHGVSVRPVRELRAFEKTELKPGKRKRYISGLTGEHLHSGIKDCMTGMYRREVMRYRLGRQQSRFCTQRK